MIDRERFRSLLSLAYRSDTDSGGHPHTEAEVLDEIRNELQHQVTTTASVHDSRVDLSQPGETVYHDKGYFGVKPLASMDKTMHRAVQNHPLSIEEERRNRAIRRVRSLVERTYAVIKRQFHAGHVLVTTMARASLQNLFACFDYNLAQLRTIHRQALEE